MILISKKIPLQNGMFAIVDDEDYERVNGFRWHIVISGTKTDLIVMRNAGVNGVNIKQILSYFILKKECTKGDSIIYKNKDKLDNRRSNLEMISTKKSTYRTKGHRNSSSRYKGVSWHKRNKKWEARINKDYKPFYIGIYKDEDDAGRAYNNKSLEFFGEYAYQNVIGSNNNSKKTIVDLGDYKFGRSESGFRGAYKKGDKYQAKVTIKGNTFYLGSFEDKEQAAKAYDKKAYELYGDRAILNFPESINEYKEKVNN